MRIKHTNISSQKCHRYTDYSLYIHACDGGQQMIIGLDIIEVSELLLICRSVKGKACIINLYLEKFHMLYSASVLGRPHTYSYNISSMWGTLTQGTCIWIYAQKRTLLHKRIFSMPVDRLLYTCWWIAFIRTGCIKTIELLTCRNALTIMTHDLIFT